MKINKTMVLCGIIAMLTLAVGSASAQNLLVNPGFESGDLTGWEVFGQTASSDVIVLADDNGPTVPGTHNAFMDNQAEGIGLTLKQSTTAGSAGPGEVYYAFDLLLDQADVGGVLFVEIFAEQAGGGVIGSSGLMGPLWDWDWTAHDGMFVAPDGTDFLTIQFMANTGAAAGTNCLAHVDNVDLNQGSVATQSTDWSSIKALYR